MLRLVHWAMVLCLAAWLAHCDGEEPEPRPLPKLDDALLSKLRRRAAKEGIDTFLERCFHNQIPMTDETWMVFYETAARMNEARKPFQPKFVEAWMTPEILTYPVVREEATPFSASKRRWVVSKPIQTQIGMTHCMVLAREGIADKRPMGRSIVFSLGACRLESVRESVLFCDGELDASGIGSSVVLNWDRLKAGTQSSGLLVCRGSMELYYLGFTTVLAYGELKVRKSTMDTRFLEPKDDPFAWLKIFDPSDIGLDVKQAKTELHITGVKNQSPFGKAGLEPGDVIASANGNPMTDYHALRRLIRRAYVEETAVSLAVRRQGKPINLKVDFKKPAS